MNNHPKHRSHRPYRPASLCAVLLLALLFGGWFWNGQALNAQAESTATASPGPVYHTVRVGEYWGLIAERYGTTIRALQAANPQLLRYNDVLRVGDRVLIPGSGPTSEPTSAASATPTHTPTATPSPTVTPSPTATPEPTATSTATTIPTEYVVQRGEGWSIIAERLGFRMSELIEANPQLVRPNYVLRVGDRIRIPGAADETDDGGTVPPATTPTSVPSATVAATPTVDATEVPDDDATGPAESTAACPADFADFPEQIITALNEAEGDPDALLAFLTSCNAAVENGLHSGDWNADGLADTVVVYADPSNATTTLQTELLILNGSSDGPVEAYRAGAAGEVQLLAIADINIDRKPDVVWTDRTCGASTCFDTVQVTSWDGTEWRNWTQNSITMAYAEVSLEDTTPVGQGQEIVLYGGTYGSVGAGPARARTEVWISLDGAPYTLLELTNDASSCLYHMVIDANAALLQGTADGFTEAEGLYQQALTDESLEACWNRPAEIAELRSFSQFRLALIAGYRGDSTAAAEQIAALADQYAESIYAQVGQVWQTAYAESENAAEACAVVNEFAVENPAAYEILADYGYANPTFAAEDVCPTLTVEPSVVAPSASTGLTEPLTTTAGLFGDLPLCPTDLSGFATVLPDLLAISGADELLLETWLRQCDAMSDERGGLRLIDANQDEILDAIFLPTVVSDLGFGPDGAQGDLLIYHGAADGSYTLALDEEIYGQPAWLAAEDLNGDGTLDLAWQVVGCSTFCVLEVQIVSWDGTAYTSIIQPGATIAEGTARFEPVPAGDSGSGSQLILSGGVSGTDEGGLAVPHTEIWQSIDGAAFQRLDWTYDRTAAGNECLGLRLIEADFALQASGVLGYEIAIERYTAALDPALQACSIYGLSGEEELVLLQGLASFRLVQAQALSGDLTAAQATLDALTLGQPESHFTTAAAQWLATYERDSNGAAACQAVETIFTGNAMLWQITDHFGYNHPTLAAEQICYQPAE